MNRLDCEITGRVDRRDRPSCRHYVAAANAPLGRRPICGLVLFSVAEREGGIAEIDIAWLLGKSRNNVQNAYQTGLKKLRVAMAGT